MTLCEQLLGMSEQDYRKFTSSPMPGVNNILGIQIPKLRSIAREIARGDWHASLFRAEDFYFKERFSTFFARFEAIRHEDHYARMTIAWAVSVRYVKLPERTEA